MGLPSDKLSHSDKFMPNAFSCRSGLSDYTGAHLREAPGQTGAAVRGKVE